MPKSSQPRRPDLQVKGHQTPSPGTNGSRAHDTDRRQAHGISAQDAVDMIVNGYCKEVFKQLPMEFAVEAQKLLGVSLEGSVG